MADETSVEAPDSGAESNPELEYAVNRLERAVGEPSEPTEEAPEAPVAAPQAPAADVEARARAEANARYQERRAKREEKRFQERLASVLASVEQRAAAPQPQSAPQAAEVDDPEPDPEDWRAYQAWRDRQMDKNMQKALDARLQPLLERHERLTEWENQQREQSMRSREENAWLERNAALMREAEDDYAAAVGPEKYYGAVSHFFGGSAPDGTPQDGLLARALQAAGTPAHVAREGARRAGIALSQGFMEQGLNPAAAVHAYISFLAGAAQQMQSGAPQAPQPQAMPQQARQAQSEVADLAATASGASSVAGLARPKAKEAAPSNGNSSINLKNLQNPASLEAWLAKNYPGRRSEGLRKVREAAYAQAAAE